MTAVAIAAPAPAPIPPRRDRHPPEGLLPIVVGVAVLVLIHFLGG